MGRCKWPTQQNLTICGFRDLIVSNFYLVIMEQRNFTILPILTAATLAVGAGACVEDVSGGGTVTVYEGADVGVDASDFPELNGQPLTPAEICADLAGAVKLAVFLLINGRVVGENVVMRVGDEAIITPLVCETGGISNQQGRWSLSGLLGTVIEFKLLSGGAVGVIASGPGWASVGYNVEEGKGVVGKVVEIVVE